MWGKEGLCNIGQKRNKKKRKKHNFTCMPANEAMVVEGLVRLEGQRTVERWGLRTRHVGKRGLQHWSEKKRKKKKKNISLLVCPRMRQ